MNLFGNTTIQLNSFNPPLIVADTENMKNIIKNYTKGFESMVYFFVGESFNITNSIPHSFSIDNADTIKSGYLYYFNGF